MIVITDTFNDDLGSIIKGCEEGAHHLSLHITIWIDQWKTNNNYT